MRDPGYISTFYADFDEACAEQEMVAAFAEAETASARGLAIKQLIESVRSYRAAAADGRVPVAVPTRVVHNDGPVSVAQGDAVTGRSSVLAIIEQGPDDVQWTTGMVADALGVDKAQHKAVGISLQRLASGYRGSEPKILRPRKGTYTKLPSESVAPEPGKNSE